ncbi:hypothetical protein Goklo_005247, partial [Gossypium klotzschianum]|nr:hypothetical protein [Gossypium klotzschianum]
MNSQNQVESTLKEILEVVKPLHEDWVTRIKIINELREVVQSIENLRGATVEPFGSFVSNLFSRWGDLDISIEVSFGQCVSSAGKKRKQTLLGELLRALRKQGDFELKFIPSARVPILKIVSKWQNISCDISIDNIQGEIKSKFLFWLNEIDGRFRDMVLLVKEWAKANGINNPKTGTFNSYSLSLLVIFHFQTCVPPILPPLKDIYPTNVVDDLTGAKVDAERRIAQVCSSNIARFKSSTSRIVNRSSLSELFISFIAKFSEINSKASELGICTFTGQWEYIANNTRWLPRTYAIFIEDPFEQPENSARAVGQKQLIKIAEVLPKYSSAGTSGCAITFANAVPSVAAAVQELKAFNLANAASRSENGALNTETTVSICEYEGAEWTAPAKPSISEAEPFGPTRSGLSASATTDSETKDR